MFKCLFLSLPLRTLFSLTPYRSPSPYSIFVAQCSTSSPPHITYPHPHSHPDPRNVRVSVWWDLNNCDVPSGVNVFKGAEAITAAIESSGIKGPIHIKAFVDILRLARTNQEALSSTASTGDPAIDFTHVPHGEDYKTDSFLFLELMFWVKQNPPPVHLFLITIFRGTASFLHRLRMNDYNILLASKESAPAVICSSATIIWNWEALVRGENLTGRYFNQPPNDSWYGHYEGPLEEIPAFAPDDQPGEVLHHEVFSQESFWIDMQTFINTDLGSLIIAESRTRKKMAYYLQKYGPSVLKSVMESDVLHLVDMLILEKKWVRESPYHRRPFKLTSANSDGTDSDYEFANSYHFSDSE